MEKWKCPRCDWWIEKQSSQINEVLFHVVEHVLSHIKEPVEFEELIERLQKELRKSNKEKLRVFEQPRKTHP